MVWVAAAVVISVLVGLFSERARPEAASDLARRALSFLLYFFFPPIVFVNLAETDFGFGMGAGLVAGLVAIVLVAGLAWFASVRLLQLSRPETGSVIACAVIPNTSYLGYPVVLALMGGEELSRAVAYDVVVGGVGLTLLGFGAGAAFGDRAGSGFGERLRSFFLRNPLLIAAILGLLTPGSWIPDVLVEISWVLVTLSLPVGFFAVGALVGPAQVAGRLLEFGVLRRVHPLLSARLAGLTHPLGVVVLVIAGPAGAAAFALLHGVGNGIMTIAKGTLPLVLFGAQGYGALTGWMMMPARVAQAAAPVLFGLALEQWGASAMWLTGALGLIAALALWRVRAPDRAT